MLNLTPIQARLAAATPGPWDTRRSEQPRHDTWSVTICQAEGGAGVVTWHARTAVPRHEGNIALIANAPQDIADLLAEVKRLRQIEAAAKGARAGLHVALDGEVHRRSVEEALRMLDCYLSDDQAS